MGCDIHSFVEERRDGQWRVSPGVYESDHRRGPGDNDSWFGGDDFVNQPSPFDNRNYGLFGFLVPHIRDDGPSAQSLLGLPDEARGVPEDASPVVKEEARDWEGDGHTFSWLTLMELRVGFAAALLQGMTGEYREQLTFCLDQMVARASEEGLSHDDIRLVFWFDN